MTTQDRSSDALEEFAEMLSREEAFVDGPTRRQIDLTVRRRRRRRGLVAAAIIVIAVLGIGGGYVGWALNAPLSDPIATSRAPLVPAPAAVQIALPSDGVTAISVSGADDYLGAEGVSWTSGSDEARPMASITKLVTALVVLDARPLTSASDSGPTLTFGAADFALYDKYYVMDATIAAMPRGSSMSLRDAIATMLIPSASNYAEAVATWAYGSQGAFLRATDRWLTAHGLTDTTVVEPTGIDPRNTSTPSDLIALGRIATAHPAIAQIVATPFLSLPGPGDLANTNTLLGSDGVTGLKTGTLHDSGSNLLYTATLDVGTAGPLSVVGVTLGGFARESVNRGVSGLLQSIRAGFHEVPLAERGQQVGSYSTPWGSSARMVLSEDASVYTWSDTPITVTMDTSTPASWIDGEVVGSVTWTAGPNTVTVPIEIEGSIIPPTDEWRLTHPGELSAQGR